MVAAEEPFARPLSPGISPFAAAIMSHSPLRIFRDPQRTLAFPQQQGGLAPLYANEAARDGAIGADLARRRIVALRLRRPSRPRCGELLVGQSVWARASRHQRRERRPAGAARARDARRLYPP